MPDFEAEFEAELLQQKQKPINAVAETTASVLPSITIDRYSVRDFFMKMSGTIYKVLCGLSTMDYVRHGKIKGQ